MNGPTLAHRAYEAFAPTYDAYAAVGDHPRWLAMLEKIAQEHGLPGRRLLDVACGTGRSAAPMVQRDYDVSACDVSPAMVRLAAKRLTREGGFRHLEVADMRNLPDWGRFDLVTCLCDAINYLIDIDELDAAFASAARRLRPGGLYVFDVNSLSTYRTFFAGDVRFDADDVRFRWRGVGRNGLVADRLYAARLDSASVAGEATSLHVQRYWPVSLVRQRLELAGLRCLTVLGQTRDIVLSEHPDESRDEKLVFVARRESN